MAAGKLRSKSGGCCWDPGSLECFRRSGLPGEAAEDPHPDRLEPGRQCEGLCIAPFLQTDTTWLLCVALLLAPGASVLETSNLSSDAWQPPQAKPEPTMQLSLRRPENEARKDDPHRAVQRRPSEHPTSANNVRKMRLFSEHVCVDCRYYEQQRVSIRDIPRSLCIRQRAVPVVPNRRQVQAVRLPCKTAP